MTHNFAMYGVSKVLVHPNDETARDKKAGGELVDFDNVDGDVAVSYTHLTLPTKA